MRRSTKTALGGIISALSVTLLLISAVIPFLEYTLPAVAGALLIVMVTELGAGWAFGTYFSVSLLAMLLLANKEAAMMYIGFFGWYPIVRPALVKRVPTAVIRFFIKLILFNASAIASYAVLIWVFGMPVEDLSDNGVKGLAVLLALGNVMFIVYDISLSKVFEAYLKHWRKKLMRTLR